MEPVKSEPLWQDRDIKFDSGPKDLTLRKGESVIEAFDFVEDTKGNSGDVGRLTVTNLRMIWQSKSKPRINLSVGLSCITSISNRTLQSKLRGKYDALHIMTKITGTRYEFIFTQFAEDGITALDSNKPEGMRLTQTLTKVCKAYTSTKLFRDLKLRSAVISGYGKQLKTLPQEQIYNKFNGVWNLSSDQGNLGTMHITNVRIVWHANMNELFNLSLPYLQVTGIRVRESKFGTALVIESTESSGGYVLGFRIDPPERLNLVYNELLNLFNVHASNPNMGVEAALHLEASLPATSQEYTTHLQHLVTDNQFIEEDADGLKQDAIAAYLAHEESSVKKDSEIVYSPDLGLAIERIRDGFTLESLWQIIPQS